jgi:nitrite reductase/ring-hydroxylating ferredoxin subunit
LAAFVEVARLADVPPGAGRPYHVSGVDVALFNVEGVIHALADACILNGTLLSAGKVRGRVVTCYPHGLQYDLTTGRMVGVPALRVDRYPVRVVDDRIHVAIDFATAPDRRVRTRRQLRPHSSTPWYQPRRR